MEGEVLGPLKEISDEEFREILRKTYGVQDEKTLDFLWQKLGQRIDLISSEQI
jgi:RNAse (barnase) inhibitor barstar